MKVSINDLPQRKAALISGWAIVTMALFAGFAYGYVLNGLVVNGDAAATADNIRAAQPLFRCGIFGFLVVLVCDVTVAWSLYTFFKPVDKSLSLLTAWFRLVYAGFLGVALLNFVMVLLLTSGAGYLKAMAADQLNALVLFFVNAFNGIWAIGLVIFGIHLFLLGYLALKSGYIPRIWGILLVMAAVCYLLTSLAALLVANYQDYKATVDGVVSVPMVTGELGFGVWLLCRGGKGNR